jgi:hypothetical protein
MAEVIEWEYRHEALKVARGGGIRSGLTDLGEHGWELIRILPLPEADEPGVFDTTIAIMLLRRPVDGRYQVHYEPIKVEENVGARFTFGACDKLGRDGWELLRVELFPQPDPEGLFDKTVGIQVFRRLR